MTPLTPEEEQAAIELANYTQRAKLSFMSMVQARQLSRALLSLKGKLEASEKRNQRERDLIRHQRMELLIADLITDSEYSELAQEHSAVKRLEDYDRLRAELGIARKAFTEWRDNPSDLADYELRRALARIAEPAPKEKV